MQAEGALALAGGTDLVTQRAAGIVDPAVVVDVKAVAELRRYAEETGQVEVGATVPLASLCNQAPEGVDALIDGASVVGGLQTRSRATLGGNLCRSSPAGDTLPPLLVLGADVRVASKDGERTVSIAEFFVGPGANVLAQAELVIGISVPRSRGGSAYRRFTYRRWMDLAVVGIAASVEVQDGEFVDAVVAAGGVAPTPRLIPAAAKALIGNPVISETVADAADEVKRYIAPIDDVRAGREFRLRIAHHLARDVIALAVQRANGSTDAL